MGFGSHGINTAPSPSTAYRNCPASLAGEIALFSCVVRRAELRKDFRPGILATPNTHSVVNAFARVHNNLLT